VLGGKLPQASRRWEGPAVTQKYKVHRNAPFKKNFKHFFLEGSHKKVCRADNFAYNS